MKILDDIDTKTKSAKATCFYTAHCSFYNFI